MACCRITRDRASLTLGSRRGIRTPNTSNFLTLPFCPFSLALPRSRFSFLRFSLCRCRAERATATGVRGDIRRNCEGCERVETSRATGRFERARENSSSLFMSFLFDLLSSRFCPSFSLSLSLWPFRFLSRPLDEREYKSGEEKRRREWEKGRKVRVAALLRPRGCRKSLVCQGRKKCDIFPRR